MKKFSRTVEDFTCRHCEAQVQGTGYTNHCHSCLWSRHVDINPGDRAARCRGMMEPVSVEQKASEHIILHRCVECGFERRNKFQEGDSFEALLEIARG